MDSKNHDHRAFAFRALPKPAGFCLQIFLCKYLMISPETLEAKRQKCAPASTGKKAKIPDAYEALWKQMQQKAAQKFLCGQWQFFLHVSMRAISPGECHFSILERNQAMVGNGHSMRVAAEIFKNLLRSAERAFAINNPMGAVEVANEVPKHRWI